MLDINQACEYLGISKSTIRKWEKEGKIKSIRTLGKHRRYELSYLEQFKKEFMVG